MSAKRASLPGFRYEEVKRLVERLLQVDGPSIPPLYLNALGQCG